MRFELIEGLYIMAPASFLFLVLGIFAFGWARCGRRMGSGRSRDAAQVPAAAFLGFLVNLLTLAVIKSTSSLTFKVMGQVKNTVVIVMSVLIFGPAITAVQVLGYAISMVGFAIYREVNWCRWRRGRGCGRTGLAWGVAAEASERGGSSREHMIS